VEIQTVAGERSMKIEECELHNDQVRLSLLSFGASIRSLEMPDKMGVFGPVHLSLDSVEQYQDTALNPYLGASVGRYANRIAGARFSLDDNLVELTPNEGGNQLHGGPAGFSRRNWELLSYEHTPAGGSVAFGLNSPDGDQGFPGNLRVQAAYELAGDTLRITYFAATDAATVVNLTNHGYWNLEGDATIFGHHLCIDADQVLPVDDAGLPAANLQEVQTTAFDFRERTTLGDAIMGRPAGFDHCYKLNGVSGKLRFAAQVDSPSSGRWMRIRTDQPAIQLYTGNGLGAPFIKHGALCLETQMFPDTPNHPELGSAVLRPGQEYRSVTELQFGVSEYESASS
jgi:aldose 1-epimerase